MSAEIRLACLKLARPEVSVPDVEQWVRRAQQLEAYVKGAGQGVEPPKRRPGRPPKVKSDNPVSGPEMTTQF